MEKRKYIRRMLQMAVLAVGMLAAGVEAWGQTTILAAGNRDTVHTRTEIIYVEENASRELYLPELRINDGVADASYQWYVHWYISKYSPSPGKIVGKDVYLDKEVASIRGGGINGGNYATDLRDAGDNDLWWYDGFFNKEVSNGKWMHLASCASTIIYTAPQDLSKADTLFCDVSSYTDYDDSGLTGDEGTFKEPTLLKRYKYVIRPASECANTLAGGNPLEQYNIDYPAESKSSINLTMLSLPGNYFWYANGNSGDMISAEGFEYRIGDNGSYVRFLEQGDLTDDTYARLLPQLQVVKISGLNGQSKQVVSVRAINGGENSPILAQYTFNPISGSGFKLEEMDISNDRTPEKFPDLYEEIGVVDFDQDNVISTSDLKADKTKNMAIRPMPQDETVYGFMFNNKTSVRIRLTPGQNQYGLYRTANVSDISTNSEKIGDKDYRWIPPLMNPDLYGSSELYDRTYERTKDSHGFFYYIDASDDPGTLVDVPIKGTLCGYTELVVTAWLADMTRPLYVTGGSKIPLAPNINLILKGTDPKTTKEEVLHYFTSGDAITNYGSSGKEANTDLMKWQQLCYRIVLPAGIDQYTDFHLEVQNNEPHTDGADYAIDDVRVYKTLPNIKVQREDACDASSLTISIDYQTMLMNMGWQSNEPIVDENTQLYSNDSDNGFDLVKYRFGLNGSNVADPTKVSAESHIGNTYFSFVEGFDENTTENVIDITDRDLKNEEDPDPIILEKGHEYRWVRVNKSLTLPVPQSMYSFRIINSTIKNDENYPDTQDSALEREKILNFRAVKDYNTAVRLYNSAEDKTTVYKPDSDPVTGQIDEIPIDDELTEANIILSENEEKYRDLVENLYMRLQIPRIRCPWIEKDEQDKIYLYTLDVNNTDLKYVGEQVGLDSNGNVIKASGEYHVVLQGAQAVEGWNPPSAENPTVPSFNLTDKCLLMSPFEVQPAVRITVDTRNNTSGLICLGTERKITAELVGTDGTTLDKDRYGFDWFLGSLEEYNKLNYSGNSVKDAIEEFRKNNDNKESFTDTDVEKWTPGTDELKAIKEGLLELFEDGLLRIDADDFSLLLTEDKSQIVAMPFVNNEVSGDIYCTDITPVNFDLDKNNVPEITPGFGNVSYPTTLTTTPIRLGVRHLHSNTTLKIPLRKDIKLGVATTAGMSNHSLIKNKYNTDVLLYDISAEEMPSVATVKNLKAENEGQGNYVELTFENNTNVNYVEGQEYILLIPFSESGDGSSSLGAACDGLAQLHIKIVPEYLTWKGDPTDLWQSDMYNWTISTSEELYNKVSNANPTRSYSPLYFTKITIPAGKELQLKEPKYEGRVLKSWASEGDDNFRYDMAVNNTGEKEAIEVVPYYINDIEQIYFKPGATLLNQHLLTYDKAWVEFEMKPGDDYWMASPLKEVYAGDMYAPTSGGQQNTEAFTDIEYGESNNRWNPAFYQKAWDNEIQYAASDADKNGIPDKSEIEKVDIVPSNWSIEYNDVTVPYAIGKGFYSRVEMTGATDNTVRVRLPKADNDYKYEYSPTTRALHDVTDKTEQPNLADLDANGSMILDLSTVDNDGDHFLVGNPYMAYLDMNKFLTNEKNSNILAQKYWTVDGKDGIIVGTPDVKWPADSELSSGYIAPMQAFFVERKDYDPDAGTAKADETATTLEVTFNAGMTVSATEVTTSDDTKSFSAVNPVLTLTATSKQGQSRAAVVQKSDASNQYEADKDAVALLDSEIDAPMAYTVAGNYAAAVNAIHDYKNVPLGVYAKDGEEVELSIEGASQLVSPLYLYDAVTRSTTPIDGDSFTLNLTGSSHGRYFLTTDEGIKAEGDIRIYSPADGQLIIASTPSDRLKQVQVYDLNGRMVESRQNVGTATCQLYVPGGIYIVRVQSEQGEAQAKLKIK